MLLEVLEPSEARVCGMAHMLLFDANVDDHAASHIHHMPVNALLSPAMTQGQWLCFDRLSSILKEEHSARLVMERWFLVFAASAQPVD